MSATAASGREPVSVEAVRAGSQEALAALYREHGAALYRLAYRLTGEQQDAEDVVHDVFVGLPEALRRYEERGSFAGWLKQVTARVALMWLRRARRRREVGLERVPDEAQQTATSEGHALQAAVNAIPGPLRTVLVLKQIEGYSHSEIADLLGISPGASRARLNRAMARLRKLLREET